jgi:hypothetical protein
VVLLLFHHEVVLILWRTLMIFTVFTASACAKICAAYPTLVAFTVLFVAARFLAVTTLGMALIAYFRLKCIGISFQYSFNRDLSFLVSFLIGTVLAVAIGTAT